MDRRSGVLTLVLSLSLSGCGSDAQPKQLELTDIKQMESAGLEKSRPEPKVLAEEIIFPDGPLKTVILQVVGKAKGPITSADLQGLTELDAESKGLKGNLSGIELCTNLRVLHLTGNQVTNLDPLRSLTRLEELHAWHNSITDLEPLRGLTNLRRLHLDENQISNLEPLSELAGLQDLFLSKNRISSVSPLKGLKSLEWVTLSDNKISDISPIGELPNLLKLSLKRNKITNAKPLLSLPKLTVVHLDPSKIPSEQFAALGARGVQVNGE